MTANTDETRCVQPAGRFEPVVDRSRCEAKGPCVTSCPYGVFAISPLTDAEKSGLSFFAKLKAFAHGNRQAHVLRGDECRACGYCVEVCPEKAITLRLREA
jgi:NAD-dependent dihydropyrimidine dehydrogenase PreA subunit